MARQLNLAETFKRLKATAKPPLPPGTAWPADSPSSAARSLLLLDGLNSDSRTHLSLELSQMRLGLPALPFSYAGVCRHYSWPHTWQCYTTWEVKQLGHLGNIRVVTLFPLLP